MRPFLLAAAAIVLFAGGAFGFIAYTSRPLGDAPPPRAAGAAVEAPQAATPAAQPAAASPAAPTPQAIMPAGGAPPPILFGPARKDAPPGSWEAVPVTARASALGPPGAALGRALAELHPRVSACFDEATHARNGQEAHTTVKDDVMDDNGVTVLMLQIETGQDEVRIVDAPLASQGGNSDALVVCVQKLLRGRAFPAPGVTAGRKHRMPYTVMQ
jgi:hypothetical protein